MMLDTKLEVIGSISMILMSLFLLFGELLTPDGFTFGHPEYYWIFFMINNEIIVLGSIILLILGIISLLICLGNFKMRKTTITRFMLVLGIISFGMAGLIIIIGAITGFIVKEKEWIQKIISTDKKEI